MGNGWVYGWFCCIVAVVMFVGLGDFWVFGVYVACGIF